MDMDEECELVVHEALEPNPVLGMEAMELGRGAGVSSGEQVPSSFVGYYSIDEYEQAGIFASSGIGESIKEAMESAVEESEGRSIPPSEDSTPLHPLKHDSLGSYTTGDFAEIEQEEMGMLLMDTPNDIEATLVHNRVYQDNLDRTISEIESKLLDIREKLESHENARMPGTSRSYAGASRRRGTSKVPALLYIHPFFKDASGMAPPRNLESLQKAATGEFDALIQPAKTWTKAECEKLKEGVMREAMSLRTRTNDRRKELVEEKLKEATDAVDDDKKAEHVEELEELEKKLAQSRQSLNLADVPIDEIEWLQIANSDLGGCRTVMECKLKWMNEVSPKWKSTSVKWNAAELRELDRIVEQRKQRKEPINWEEIAKELNTGRTLWQCFEKYQMHLNRDIVKDKWSEEEDEGLKKVVDLCRTGSYIDWNQVAFLMDGRTRNQCQTRWRRSLDSSLVKGRWTEEEDLALMLAVAKYGPKEYGKIAEGVPGRNEAQCRDRWTQVLDSSVNKDDWTEEEDQRLIFAHEKFRRSDGIVEWAKISQIIPGRVPSACKARYKSMEKFQRAERAQMATEQSEERKRKRSGSLSDDPVSGFRASRTQERKKKLEERRRKVHRNFEEMSNLKVEDLRRRNLLDEEEKQERFLDTLPEQLRREFRAKLAALRFRSTRQRIKAKRRISHHEPIPVEDGSAESELVVLERNLKREVQRLDKRIATEQNAEQYKRKVLEESLYQKLKTVSHEDENPLPPSRAAVLGFLRMISTESQNYRSECFAELNAIRGSTRNSEESSPLPDLLASSKPAVQKFLISIKERPSYALLQKQFDLIYTWPAALLQREELQEKGWPLRSIQYSMCEELLRRHGDDVRGG